MLGGGEISERASIAPLLAAKAGSKFGDLQTGDGDLLQIPNVHRREDLERVAICSLDRARHA